MNKGLIVHCVLINAGKILITKRSDDDEVFPSVWDIPGGTVEDGEAPTDGVIRETKEEAGIDIDNPVIFESISNIDEGKNKQFITLFFKKDVGGADIQLSEDHSEYKWVTIAELADYEMVPRIKEVLIDNENMLK